MRKAFTLVEMLVALVLISLLIGVAVFAFRLQLITIHKAKTEGLNTVIKYTQVRSLIESMKYYVVQEYNMLNLPTKQLHLFFNGDQREMKFITTNPILSSSDALVELVCKDHKLIYKEEPLFDRIDFLQPDLLEDSREIVLYKDLQQCRFSYKNVQGVKTGELENIIPKAIEIRIEDKFGKIVIYASVKEDNTRLVGEIYDAMYPTE